MTDCIVYGPAYSTFTRSLCITLEEKGVPYSLENVDLLGGAHQQPEHLARQPFGKVPAFAHGDFELYESLPAMFYIDEAFDGISLQPQDVRERARMRQVLGIINSYAYPSWITNILMPRVVVPMMGGTTDEAQITAAIPLARLSVAALDRLIGANPYCAGSVLSLADLHLAPVYDYLSQTPEGETLLADASNLARWWASIGTRPSVEKTKPSLG